MMTSRAPWRAIIVATTCVVAACSDAQDVAPVSFDSVAGPGTSSRTLTTPVDTASTPVDDLPTTTAPTPATSPATGPATSVVGDLSGPTFSAALGVKVDTAPGVNTRGDTRQLLPEGLYVHIAWEPDPDDPSVFTVQPEDIEILEAYANGALAFYRAATTTVSTESSDFAAQFIDGGAKFDVAFKQARDGGYVKDLGLGVTLRPYVIADSRTSETALVFDCTSTHEQWVTDGDPPDGLTTPALLGTVVTMRNVDGSWFTDTVAADSSPCF